MRYIITFSLDNGDKIEIRVEGGNQAEALAKIQETPEVVDKLEEHLGDSSITKVDIMPDHSEEDEELADYSIQDIGGEKWLFHHEFPRFYARLVDGNEPLADISFSEVCDALTSAKAMRRAGDFVIKYRKRHGR